MSGKKAPGCRIKRLVSAGGRGYTDCMSVNAADPAPGGKPKLLDQVRAVLRVRHYAVRTEQAYTDWIRRFIVFHGRRHPADLGGPEALKAGHMSQAFKADKVACLVMVVEQVDARNRDFAEVKGEIESALQRQLQRTVRQTAVAMLRTRASVRDIETIERLYE